jgi:hypothetical protein
MLKIKVLTHVVFLPIHTDSISRIPESKIHKDILEYLKSEKELLFEQR